jgi:hypothetical protein
MKNLCEVVHTSLLLFGNQECAAFSVIRKRASSGSSGVQKNGLRLLRLYPDGLVRPQVRRVRDLPCGDPAAAAMILLSGCAMAMPLRPLATSSQDSRDRDFYCRADPKCSHKSVGSLINVRSPLTVARYTMHLISF